MSQTISSIQKICENTSDLSFRCFFLDEEFNESYESDLQFGISVPLFAALAIFIALLGLFGLSTYMTILRTKEISVRKVLRRQHSGHRLPALRQYLLLVCIAGLLISPLAYFAIEHWLEGFAFHMPNQPYWYVAPILGTVLIAGIATAWQTIRTAKTDPGVALKHE